MNHTAILSSFDKYTTFSFGDKKLSFRTCNNLERYTKINLWDAGYIEVMAKYNKNAPSCNVNLLQLSRYAKKLKKKLVELTKEEVQMFAMG